VDDREALTRLRSLVVRGDGAGLVAALSQGLWPADSLRLIGDGLLAAVQDDIRGSVELAFACVNALGERRWRGDRELMEGLEAALGNGPTPMLRPLPVDLEELCMVLEDDPVRGSGRIDVATGEVWPRAAIEYAQEVGEEEDDDLDRWLWVECAGSRSAYQDMVWFINDLDDPALADRLARAISGRGAFRRFKAALFDRPNLMMRWYAFSHDRQRGGARSWLAAEGYTPTRSK
jgi:hypothetical protein